MSRALSLALESSAGELLMSPDMHFTISDLGSRQYLQSEVEELRAAEEPGQSGLS